MTGMWRRTRRAMILVRMCIRIFPVVRVRLRCVLVVVRSLLLVVLVLRVRLLSSGV